MKKMKVENVSSMKLDFFLKQNNVDVRIAIGSGESSWCDEGSVTRSMILYHRKKLIKVFAEDSTIEIDVNVNNDEILDKLHTTEDIRTIALDIVPPQSMLIPEPILNTKLNFDSIEKQAQPTMDDINKVCDTLDKKFGIPQESEISDSFTPLEKAQKETADYKKESEKTYKGKKRGRKKKRGPKPGSKRNKGGNNPTTSI